MLRTKMGAPLPPLECFLLMRGMRTLFVRYRQASANAMAIARHFEGHPRVERVLYPGLPSHPQHALAKKQMHGFGGMITFYLKGGLSEARRFLEKVSLFTLAESLGGVESLIEHPAIMTHASVPDAERKLLGISDTMIRVSVGIEDLDDLTADLDQALSSDG
jgi:cystathionine gamma-lyase